MMYEVAHFTDGELHRGGIKAPLLRVGKWIRELMETDKDTVYVAVPADDDAVTEEEFEAEMDAWMDAREYAASEEETA